jgi:chemotaxis protein methyltransferase CheR
MSLSTASFEFVRAVLRQHSAHHLEEDKVYLVETRLLPMARRHGFPSVEDLLIHLRSHGNNRLIGELVESMTIKETFFFRDSHAFEALQQKVIPELIQRRSGVRCLNVWSAACSSGQEPYSVALLLHHHFPELCGWNVRLLASDVSEEMLERGRRGRYTDLEVSRGLPPDLRKACFQEQDMGWQIRDDLRRMVEWQRINLDSAWPSLPPLDLILLRNVLIYFELSTRQQILNRVRQVLQPDGYLMLGGAETTYNLDDRFVPISIGQTSFFQFQRARGELDRLK